MELPFRRPPETTWHDTLTGLHSDVPSVTPVPNYRLRTTTMPNDPNPGWTDPATSGTPPAQPGWSAPPPPPPANFADVHTVMSPEPLLDLKPGGQI